MKGKASKMPNSGSKSHAAGSGKSGSNTGKTGGLKKSNEMRSDVTKTPSSPNHFPNGLA